jgi:hypothetical protein
MTLPVPEGSATSDDTDRSTTTLSMNQPTFIVADEVEVLTRKAGLDKAEAVHWKSSGESDYSVETATK